MKKTMLLGFTFFSIIFLTACSNTKTNPKQSTDSTSKSEVASSKVFSPEDKGNGEMNLVNQSGNTADGKEIVIYFEENKVGQGFDVITKEIDGGKLSFLYSDGKLIEKKQLSNSQTPIQLDSEKIDQRSEVLSEGKHTFQLVQYNNDDQKSDPVTIKTKEYTVKESK